MITIVKGRTCWEVRDKQSDDYETAELMARYIPC